MTADFNQADFDALNRAVKLENYRCELQKKYSDTKIMLSKLKPAQPKYKFKNTLAYHVIIPYKKLPYSEEYSKENIANLKEEYRQSMLHDQIMDLLGCFVISLVYAAMIYRYDIPALNWGFAVILAFAFILVCFNFAKYILNTSVTIPDRIYENSLIMAENKKIEQKNEQLKNLNLEIKKKNQPIEDYNKQHRKEQEDRVKQEYLKERARLQSVLHDCQKGADNAALEKERILEQLKISKKYRDIEHLQMLGDIMWGRQVSISRAEAIIKVQEENIAAQEAKFREQMELNGRFVDMRMALLQQHFEKNYSAMFGAVKHLENKFDEQAAQLERYRNESDNNL